MHCPAVEWRLPCGRYALRDAGDTRIHMRTPLRCAAAEGAAGCVFLGVIHLRVSKVRAPAPTPAAPVCIPVDRRGGRGVVRMCVYVCRQVGTWRSASCQQRGKQAWQEGVSLCSWMCQGGSVVPEVVRVPKNSDSSGGDGQARVHHHPKKPLVKTIPSTTQVVLLRAPYCGV